MEAKANTQFGICYECQIKNGDSSKKPIYHCDLCQKWFCELHSKPKFPYFIDWETQFNVQGNPAVKAMFYSEHGREDGHADFEYLRMKIMEMELEEQYENWLIQKAIDRMVEADRIRNEKAAKKAAISVKPMSLNLMTDEDNPLKKTIQTYENKFGHGFSVPKEVYADKIFRERLNNANLLCEVEEIVAEFYKRNLPPQENVKTQKKRHWWQL